MYKLLYDLTNIYYNEFGNVINCVEILDINIEIYMYDNISFCHLENEYDIFYLFEREKETKEELEKRIEKEIEKEVIKYKKRSDLKEKFLKKVKKSATFEVHEYLRWHMPISEYRDFKFIENENKIYLFIGELIKSDKEFKFYHLEKKYDLDILDFINKEKICVEREELKKELEKIKLDFEKEFNKKKEIK